MQKLPVNNFESVKDTSGFNKDFIKKYKEESDKGYFLEFDVQYLEKFYDLHNDLLFLPERVEKLVANLHDKAEFLIHIKNLKQTLNHGLILKKVYRVIKVNQNAWLKHIYWYGYWSKKKAKNEFDELYSFWKNSGEKTVENMGKHI